MMQDFEEYIRQGELAQREKASTWQTAIGLQDVDGLKPSAYLLDTARRHVEGDITIDEVQQLIKTYYQSKTNHTGDEDDQEEADRAAANITRILSRHTLAFNTNAQRGVDYDYSFLVKFFRNLLLGEQNELRNRYMHLDYKTTGDVQSATAKVPKEVSKEQLEGLNAFGGQRGKQRGKLKSKQKSKQKTADRIIDILQQNSHATRKDIARELALSESTIYKNIEKLKAEGKLIRIGGDKGGHWTIVE